MSGKTIIIRVETSAGPVDARASGVFAVGDPRPPFTVSGFVRTPPAPKNP